jgi:hypothetical protein
LLRGRRLCLPAAFCLAVLFPPFSHQHAAAHVPSLNANAIIVPNRIGPDPFILVSKI